MDDLNAFIGSFLLTAILFFCFHQWNKSLDEEVLEEEYPSYESKSWEFQIRKAGQQ